MNEHATLTLMCLLALLFCIAKFWPPDDNQKHT